MAWPASEVATLIVRGIQYQDWESVWVQERWTESFSFFKFTANEGRTPPRSWKSLQFLPGDDCTIILGGVPVIQGTIITRQMSADKNSHMVQLTGKSLGFYAWRSSVFVENGNFDGMNFVQIANKVLAPWGGIAVVGQPDAQPFVKEQAQIGMKIWDYLEQLARRRHIILGVNRAGQPQAVGPHTGNTIGSIVEGVNMEAVQCTITNEDIWLHLDVTSQQQGGDQVNMTQASQVAGHADSFAARYTHLIIPAEDPSDVDAANKRAYYEKLWTEATQVTVNATVQGWFSPQGYIWAAGSDVEFDSDMAMIHGVLTAKTVTFTQDNESGTQTTLELVAPWGLNDQPNINVSPVEDSGIPAAPSETPSLPPPTPTPNPPPTSGGGAGGGGGGGGF